MMKFYVRNKRESDDVYKTRDIVVEKRSTSTFSGIVQILINITIYLLIFFLFFRDNMQYMGIFIAFMGASALAQIFIRIGKTIRKKEDFPFFYFEGDKKLYKKHLEKVNKEIDDTIIRFREFIYSNMFSIDDSRKIVETVSKSLWCRLPNHEDFLNLNLGMGSYKYPITVSYPKYNYNEYDKVLAEFKKVYDSKINNDNNKMLPYGLSLKRCGVISLSNKCSDMECFSNIINGLILDLAIMQSYEELKLAFIVSKERPIYWTRFLPHTWSGEVRYINNGDEDETEFINNLLNEKRDLVIFIDVDYVIKKPFYDIFNNFKLPENISVVFFSYTGIAPSRIEHNIKIVKYNNNIMYLYNEMKFSPIIAEYSLCEDIAKKLYNIKLIDNRGSDNTSIPDRVTFFELYDVVSAINIPKASLRENSMICQKFIVPIGISANKQIVAMDLSEYEDGPHCLVTGTTGSGKSEFLLTFILSACLKYNPEYFSFVIVDFKGGSIANRVNQLTHCAGYFSNETGNITKRHISRIITMLKSETSYRTNILKDADCNKIEEYHLKYSKGEVSKPLPLLLVVIDEVAVFFSEDNETSKYISDLITVGRSFGIYLLLATQSKNGVIHSQINTNINGRVNFYTGDEDVKKQVIKKGRIVINSHSKNNFQCQVAISSVLDSNIEAVDFITISGKSRMAPDNVKVTQFKELSEEVQNRYSREKDKCEQNSVLTQPFENVKESEFAIKKIENEEFKLYDKGRKSVLVGKIDDIYNRTISNLWLNLFTNNIIIYGQMRTGKTTLIKTIILSLVDEYSGVKPNEVNIYIVSSDIEEYMLYKFPHVGSILDKANLYYLFLYLIREIHQRQMQKDQEYKPIIVFIEGCYDEIIKDTTLSEMLKNITEESIQCNITIIITSLHKQNFGNYAMRYLNGKISFYMGEGFDYSSLSMNLGVIKNIPNIQGRCLIDIQGLDGNICLFEAQISNLYNLHEKEIEKKMYNYNNLWTNKRGAEKIPIMPENIYVKLRMNATDILVGYTKDLREKVWDYGFVQTYLISYVHDIERDSIVSCFVNYFIKVGYKIIIADDKNRRLSVFKDSINVEYIGLNNSNLKQANHLDGLLKGAESKTIIFINDFVRMFTGECMNSNVAKTLISKMEDTSNEILFVLSDMPQYINRGRSSGTYIIQYLENRNSGLLLGNSPDKHTFGFSALPVLEQSKILEDNWGVSVSPNEVAKVKIINGVADE